MHTRTDIGRLGPFAYAAVILLPGAAAAQTFSTLAVPSELLTWATVANTATVIPGGDGRTFNAFNQPSVNTDGLVVLRGRSKGSQGAGEPLRGIYSRNMGKSGPLTLVFDGNTVVPQPNNVTYQGALGTFTEFPAFPRIGIDNATMLTRAQSKPVWTYVLPDLTETRVGTSGIYAQPEKSAPVTAEAQLGAVPGFGWFTVPGAPAGTKFDQFPGAPGVADASTVVFKGNYTDVTSKTGIFFRDTKHATSPTQLIASSDTLIPGAGGVRFGSTAPPSASARDVVFVGLDNEEAPTLGGIYRARLANRPTLQPLVAIGQQVPGEANGMTFDKLGEGLSYDGQYVSFWGAWGTETRAIVLYCPTDGQKDVIAYCNEQYPTGMATTVPVHQGFFVYDLKNGQVVPVAKTGTEYLDMLYWVFSGRPPAVGDSESEDFEPPRWRASAFSATYSTNAEGGHVAFKARKQGFIPVDGIYLSTLAIDRKGSTSAISTLAETGMQAQLIDPMAPAGAKVTTVGIERDGLRDRWLAMAASMLDPLTSESWAGVYVTRLAKK